MSSSIDDEEHGHKPVTQQHSSHDGMTQQQGEPRDGSSGGDNRSPGEARQPKEGRLYTRVVYVRVTETEWRAIQRRAHGSDFSMSRYLVRTALTRKPPPSREERARLEAVLYRLRRTAIRLWQLAGLRWMQTADPETVEMIRETAMLLDGLIREMTRRVFGAGR